MNIAREETTPHNQLDKFKFNNEKMLSQIARNEGAAKTGIESFSRSKGGKVLAAEDQMVLGLPPLDNDVK